MVGSPAWERLWNQTAPTVLAISVAAPTKRATRSGRHFVLMTQSSNASRGSAAAQRNRVAGSANRRERKATSPESNAMIKVTAPAPATSHGDKSTFAPRAVAPWAE